MNNATDRGRDALLERLLLHLDVAFSSELEGIKLCAMRFASASLDFLICYEMGVMRFEFENKGSIVEDF